MGTLRRNQPTATLTATMLHNLAFLCVVGYASAGLVHYPNGAVVPVDPANQVATAAHLAAKAYASPYYHAGYHYLGKREADADADASLVTYPNGAVVPYNAYNFGYLPYVQPLVAHPNGAVVPLEPASVVKA